MMRLLLVCFYLSERMRIKCRALAVHQGSSRVNQLLSPFNETGHLHVAIFINNRCDPSSAARRTAVQLMMNGKICTYQLDVFIHSAASFLASVICSAVIFLATPLRYSLPDS